MRKSLLVLTVFVLSLVGGIAKADVVFGASSSQVYSVSMYTDNLGQIDHTAFLLNGTSPAPYAHSYGPFPIDELIEGFFQLTAESGTGAASSDVDGTAGSKTASGSVSLTSATFSIIDILTLTGDLSASASAFGDVGNMNGFASSSISNGALTVLGNTVSLGFGEIYNQDGLRIVMHDTGLNNGNTFAEASATMFFVEFTDFAHGGDVYNGTFEIASASANMRAVPEPATALVLGALGLATALRRRRR